MRCSCCTCVWTQRSLIYRVWPVRCSLSSCALTAPHCLFFAVTTALTQRLILLLFEIASQLPFTSRTTLTTAGACSILTTRTGSSRKKTGRVCARGSSRQLPTPQRPSGAPKSCITSGTKIGGVVIGAHSLINAAIVPRLEQRAGESRFEWYALVLVRAWILSDLILDVSILGVKA